jgi:O-acetyl-ADP-ribose deacetylase (regulator of RNase III)
MRRRTGMLNRWCGVVAPLAALGMLLALGTAAGQTAGTLRFPDNSDWWSGGDYEENIATQKRELPATAFQIASVQLGERMFRNAATILGKAVILERGDASTGRSQACYVSEGAGPKMYLIFEEGELDFTFYLFTGGPAWEGKEYCVESKAVSAALATKSGLRLGQTPEQVASILGPPAKRKKEQLIYSTAVQKKVTAQELKNAREDHPEMSEKEIRQNFGMYTLGEGVDARFEHGKLVYLAVSKSEVE